ncbi:hypothetical protein [Noviherbaspirillum soli]|uniref:hypothetical protein n=1 Tax=Noviherbaspirillum soli TaxID=1064518 RepID=UPI00188B46F4|nr:hypothetical protein [Noviherbaspirillum soli]
MTVAQLPSLCRRFMLLPCGCLSAISVKLRRKNKMSFRTARRIRFFGRMHTLRSGVGIIAVPAPCFSVPDGQRGFSIHKSRTMVKRQKGLTIIQLMVLLLIAGIVGSLLLKIIIEHRCQSDPSASLCIRHASAAGLEMPGQLSRQSVQSA